MQLVLVKSETELYFLSCSSRGSWHHVLPVLLDYYYPFKTVKNWWLSLIFFFSKKYSQLELWKWIFLTLILAILAIFNPMQIYFWKALEWEKGKNRDNRGQIGRAKSEGTKQGQTMQTQKGTKRANHILLFCMLCVWLSLFCTCWFLFVPAVPVLSLLSLFYTCLSLFCPCLSQFCPWSLGA